MAHISMALVMVSAVVMLATLLIVDAEETKECIKDSHPCIHETECCSGCCVDEKCLPFADNCVAAKGPCSVHECPPGKTCYLEQVQCIQAPCPPVPACKDADYDYN